MKFFKYLSVKGRVYLILTIVLILAMCTSVILWLCSEGKEPPVQPEELITVPDETVVIREVEKLVEVEKVITAQIIEDGLRDMGKLVTAEYFFTEVISYSDQKKLFGKINLPFTKSSYLASYDGTVWAGIDFSDISVKKDDTGKNITVTLHHAEIQSVNVDKDSLTTYSEKEGLGNPTTLADYNTSLTELENTAKKKAKSRGLLDSADENAKLLIEKFIIGLIGAEYRTSFVYA